MKNKRGDSGDFLSILFSLIIIFGILIAFMLVASFIKSVAIINGVFDGDDDLEVSNAKDLGISDTIVYFEKTYPKIIKSRIELAKDNYPLGGHYG